MFRFRCKAITCRAMVIFTLMACVLSFGGTGLMSARKASADSVQTKEKQAAQESVYTIQTASFRERQRAEKQFRLLEQSLEGTALQALRIEKIESIYAVRVGRFASFTEAKQFLKQYEPGLAGAMVMKAYFIDKRILLMHDGIDKDLPEVRAGLKSDRSLPDIRYASDALLGLKLVGTALRDEPGSSIAIIEDLASGDQEIYKKGDTLKGVLVKRILARGVILDEGNGNEILIMVGGTGTAALQSDFRRGPTGKKVVDAKVTDFKSMIRGIGVRPYLQGGRPVGFAIYNIRPKSVFANAGLENCDVITAVNGKPVEVSREPDNFYKSISQGGEITIDVKRDDVNQKLIFEIKE